MSSRTDVLIVGAGLSGFFAALNFAPEIGVTIISKEKIDESGSYLAQGGIACLLDDDDYDPYYEDTMKAGHYENDPLAVETMIKSSPEAILGLERLGVSFDKSDGGYSYTKEGGHSAKRILHNKDITGKEIMRKLIANVRGKKNIKLVPWTKMVDIKIEGGFCKGVVAESKGGERKEYSAAYTILATGGIGGLFASSTNFRQLTGDAIALAIAKGVRVKNLDYVQVHPTAFWQEGSERRYLISESLRGEGAVLLGKNGERFASELLTRDLLTEKIKKQMKKDGRDFVMLDARPIGEEKIKGHFPNIYEYCLGKGYDITKEPVPVAPAQHYFMGGIDVDINGRTSAEALYAIGETACTGVHGKNRLASNSLLEAVVFAKRAAKDIGKRLKENCES
jgi:L-aspartate oxidase